MLKFAIDKKYNTVYVVEGSLDAEVLTMTPVSSLSQFSKPFEGTEEEVTEFLVGIFNAFQKGSPLFFKDMGEILVRNAILVLKRTKGDSATMVDFREVINNTDGLGVRHVKNLRNAIAANQEELRDNHEVVQWFMEEYYNVNSNLYGYCSMIRALARKFDQVNIQRANPTSEGLEMSFS